MTFRDLDAPSNGHDAARESLPHGAADASRAERGDATPPALRQRRAGWAVVAGQYTFAPARADLVLLSLLGAVAQKANAPFVAGASPAFLSLPEISGRKLTRGMKIPIEAYPLARGKVDQVGAVDVQPGAVRRPFGLPRKVRRGVRVVAIGGRPLGCIDAGQA